VNRPTGRLLRLARPDESFRSRQMQTQRMRTPSHSLNFFLLPILPCGADRRYECDVGSRCAHVRMYYLLCRACSNSTVLGTSCLAAWKTESVYTYQSRRVHVPSASICLPSPAHLRSEGYTPSLRVPLPLPIPRTPPIPILPSAGTEQSASDASSSVNDAIIIALYTRN
jgi:hypothetical protein